MRSLLRLLATLLAGVVVAAAVTPCPSSARLASGAEPSVRAQCPCSCAHGKPPGLAGGHLDFALARADVRAAPPLLWPHPPAPVALPPAAPAAPADPVPI